MLIEVASVTPRCHLIGTVAPAEGVQFDAGDGMAATFPPEDGGLSTSMASVAVSMNELLKCLEESINEFKKVREELSGVHGHEEAKEKFEGFWALFQLHQLTMTNCGERVANRFADALEKYSRVKKNELFDDGGNLDDSSQSVVILSEEETTHQLTGQSVSRTSSTEDAGGVVAAWETQDVKPQFPLDGDCDIGHEMVATTGRIDRETESVEMPTEEDDEIGDFEHGQSTRSDETLGSLCLKESLQSLASRDGLYGGNEVELREDYTVDFPYAVRAEELMEISDESGDAFMVEDRAVGEVSIKVVVIRVRWRLLLFVC
ncbi:hypothetical protein Tcan_08493 [Toxocara canis]|uniref:Uncharacterized protein n=1 Tax=Toxocara canis TaxID=6265 RepID=A0A0B2VR03_TOXCA|nr:hypothetical protein Tcan_08493 [Toxocara canis]